MGRFKYTLTVEAEDESELDDLKKMMYSNAMEEAIFEVKCLIKSRLKHSSEMSEDMFLELLIKELECVNHIHD